MTNSGKEVLKEAVTLTENAQKPSTVYKIRIMQAYVDGFPIEVYIPQLDGWFEVKKWEPEWNWGSENYRIKRDEKRD